MSLTCDCRRSATVQAIPPAVLPAPEAAEYIGIKTSLLAELTARGEIPSLKIASRRLYRRESLDRWLEALEAGA